MVIADADQPDDRILTGRPGSKICLTIELAAERGDWETVHEAHDFLIGLYEKYRATYPNRIGRSRTRTSSPPYPAAG